MNFFYKLTKNPNLKKSFFFFFFFFFFFCGGGGGGGGGVPVAWGGSEHNVHMFQKCAKLF